MKKNILFEKEKTNIHDFLKHPTTIKGFKTHKKRKSKMKKPQFSSLIYKEGKFKEYFGGRFETESDLEIFAEGIKSVDRSGAFYIAKEESISLILKDFLREEKKAFENVKNKGSFDFESFEFTKDPVFIEEVYKDFYFGVLYEINGSLRIFTKDDVNGRFRRTWIFNLDRLEKNVKNDLKSIRKGFENMLNDIFDIFGCFPEKFISIGQIAKFGMSRSKEIKKFFDFNKFKIKNKKNKNELYDKAFSIASESFKGGISEVSSVGYSKEGYYSDINGAYLKAIVDINDYTGRVIKRNEIEDGKDYLIRGFVEIPFEIDFSPILVRDSVSGGVNISPRGNFKASYTSETRKKIMEMGGCFYEEEIYEIQKSENKSKEVESFFQKIAKEKERGNKIAKKMAVSAYGLTYEAFKADDSSFVAGEFFNPIIATFITSKVRNYVADAAQSIVENGGKVHQIVVDSILSSKPLDKKYWKKNTLGWFSEPEKVNDLFILGNGLYVFKDSSGKDKQKTRGIESSNLDMRKVRNIIRKENKEILEIKTKRLFTTNAFVNGECSFENWGKYRDFVVDLDVYQGFSKRMFPNFEPKKLADKMFDGHPKSLNGEDKTFPEMRK